MTPEFLNHLNQYTKSVKQELPTHDQRAVPIILQLITVIDYMKTELQRWQGEPAWESHENDL
jgi:hypothetical protein